MADSVDTPAPLVKTLPVIRFASLESDGIVHGVTTRTPELPLGGNMSYMVGGNVDLVRFNRNAWAGAIGYDPWRLVLGRQVHETRVVPVGESNAGAGADCVETSIRRVDGLMTNTSELPIGVMAADCVPILVHDPEVGAVAAVHAGWRGTVNGIAAEAVTAMAREYGSRPSDLRVVLGPSICASCYQVGDEVVDGWAHGPYSGVANPVRVTEECFYFDLRAANLGQLVESGVGQDSVEISPMCTQCANGRMFSRRGLGPRTGLFTAVIMLSSRDQGNTGESS